MGKNSLTSNASTATATTGGQHSIGNDTNSFLVGLNIPSQLKQEGGMSQHAQMQAMRKGNHRRTKSTHPDELNKMMFSL